MMLVGNSCKAGICVSVICKHIKPGVDRKLRNHNCRFPSITGIKYFKKISAFIEIKIHQAKVIYHKKIEFRTFVRIR